MQSTGYNQSGYNPSPKKSEAGGASRLFGTQQKDSPRYGGQQINQNTESSNFGGFGKTPASPGEQPGSARRSSGLRMSGGMAGLDVGASLDSNNPNRPPLYVPSRRDPNLNRDGTATFGKPPSSGASRLPKATAAQEYQFRTDFNYSGAAAESQPHPYFARQASPGSSASR